MDKLFMVLGSIILVLGLTILFYYEGGGAGTGGSYDAYMGMPLVLGGILFLILAFLPPKKGVLSHEV